MYGHTVELSSDGNNWSLVYEQECTGWEFKPIELNCRKVKCFRVTIHSVSEGRAGMGEVTLFGKRKLIDFQELIGNIRILRGSLEIIMYICKL